jgi:uncharacterized protein (DUF1499 family)
MMPMIGWPADTAGIDFATLARPATPNTYLVCPKDRCAVPPDEEGPVFRIPPMRLLEFLRATLPAEPRTRLVRDESDLLRLVLVQRSRVFRFPDTVTVQVFPLPDGGSTLAMYSRSNYGRSDLGVNKARVRRWLGLTAAHAIERPKT